MSQLLRHLQAVIDCYGDARQIGQRLLTTVRTCDLTPAVHSQLVCTSLSVSKLWCLDRAEPPQLGWQCVVRHKGN